jgi:hypothetical protein
MIRVFLSYASADSAVAEQITRDWRERGVDVFRFGEPEHQGQIIVDEIERQIRAADAFVALISPAYWTSEWCKRESRLAIRRENNLRRQFIFVVRVAPTSPDDAGMLGDYSWVDAAGSLTVSRLDNIAVALRLGRRPTGDNVTFPGFHNRADELNKLLGALQTTGVKDLWVVVSPPLMGKTWLLAKVEKELVNASPSWSVHRLDLRREPTELRFDPARLVTALLQVADVAADRLEEDDLESIALAVNERAEPLLFILDSADLITATCATAARAALTAIHHIVRTTGRRERFALVVGTRRHDEWRGLGPDALTGQRFEPLHLTQFTNDVVYQALLDLKIDIGKEQRWSHAVRLQRLSEGLPALLVRCVQWAAGTGFRRMADTQRPAVFDAVARDYVQKDLLAADSLLPTGAARPEEALVVLRKTLQVLSTYRIYTQSHLAFHLGEDLSLQEALGAAGWTSEELWAELGRTALQSQEKADEIWNEIEPSLRRLLHRYHHPTDAERSAAHATARRFYSGWAQDRAAGREQQVVLVECLWHEAVRLTIDEPGAVAEQLPLIAVELARTCGPGPMFKPAEFREAVSRRLRDDDELQLLLGNREGLFVRIVDLIRNAIGGDE